MDLRIRELELLAKIDRSGRLSHGPFQGPERDIAAFLVYHGYVNGLTLPWVHNEQLSCLSWKWRKRSSVKIAERTYEKRAPALHC